MLSSVTINFQVTKIVMNLGCQLSVSQMSQVPLDDIIELFWIAKIKANVAFAAT